ncbi:unnamed protein product [Arabis nemorensis]|uniref:LOB domain-containing protein n=1 Tax=Arabis nemorensis TaxID=586526 RepID=A0A565BU10_9BRAS|nr:unnamed protein product [Arabis nemorensis]
MEALAVNVERGPCAVCIERNKICGQNCEFAAYFPNQVLGEYECANQLFGTPKIMKMMKQAPIEKKQDLANSILKEGVAWTEDPVRGGFGMLRRLMWEIELRKLYLRELKDMIKNEKKKKN